LVVVSCLNTVYKDETENFIELKLVKVKGNSLVHKLKRSHRIDTYLSRKQSVPNILYYVQ